jgi:hypothetical protein
MKPVQAFAKAEFALLMSHPNITAIKAKNELSHIK